MVIKVRRCACGFRFHWIILTLFLLQAAHAVDEGAVWVCHDYGVTKLSSSGDTLFTVLKDAYCMNLSVSRYDGSVWVADLDNDTYYLDHLSSTGQSLARIDLGNTWYIYEIDASTADGSCWIYVSAGNGTLRNYDKDGTLRSEIPLSGNMLLQSISVDKRKSDCWVLGRIYRENGYLDSIIQFEATGEVKSAFIIPGVNNYYNFYSLKVSSVDNSLILYGYSYPIIIKKYSMDGTELFSLEMNNRNESASDIAVDQTTGDFWFVTRGYYPEEDTLVRYNSQGTFQMSTPLENDDSYYYYILALDEIQSACWVGTDHIEGGLRKQDATPADQKTSRHSAMLHKIASNGTILFTSSDFENIYTIDVKNPLSLTPDSKPDVETILYGGKVTTGCAYSLKLQVLNRGGTDAKQTVATVALPNGLSFVSNSNGGIFNPVTRTISWNLGDFAARGVKIETIVLSASASILFGDTLRFYATTSTTSVNENPSNNNDTLVVSATGIQPDVVVSLYSSRLSVGFSNTYYTTINNTGDPDAFGITVRTTLPPKVQFVSASNNGIYSPTSHEVTWVVDTLKSRKWEFFSTEVKIPTSVPNGTILVANAAITVESPGNNRSNDTITNTGTAQYFAPDVVPSLYSGILRSGFNSNFSTWINNTGDPDAYGITVTTKLPAEAAFLGASEGGVYSSTTHAVTWLVDTLHGRQWKLFSISVNIPATVSLGTVLTAVTTISVASPGNNPLNDTVTYQGVVRNSWDPNDKLVSPTGAVKTGDWLTYTIRYENEGTANALSILIRDTLAPELDESSLLFNTENVVFDNTNRVLTWVLDNINLPPQGQGFVSFIVRTKPALTTGTIIKNRAAIVFDFNPEMMTPLVETKIVNENPCPTAVVSPDSKTVQKGATVTVDGSESFDPDSETILFAWSVKKPDGTIVKNNQGSLNTYVFTAEQVGTYVVYLRVSDASCSEGGSRDSSTILVTDESTCTAPTAEAGDGQTVPCDGLVMLDGTASTSSDGSVLSFRWEMIKKPKKSAAVLKYSTFDSPLFKADMRGSYVIQLVVGQQCNGGVNHDTDYVVVNAIDNVYPGVVSTLLMVNGSICANQKVVLRDSYERNRLLTTDNEGWVRFRNVPPGRFTVIVKDKKIDTLSMINGEVRVNNKPVLLASVKVVQKNKPDIYLETDEQGQYQTGALKKGVIKIIIADIVPRLSKSAHAQQTVRSIVERPLFFEDKR
ncbi:MAG: hypothetical protein JW795_06730 [Chitinivibrionales bacterium]|nr:hypothetical protein [Chitinivibrionales bacterium]